MKLAEALQERADLNRKIAQLRERLENNAIVQEGEKTPEDPAQLLVELDASIRRLEELMARINKTNTRTLDGEKSITDLIARKDALRVQVDAY
ncbi:MAG: DIP1984 family protein, partial [Oscillospiraceae bacterium]|nr:DIP1984 family protein [Oscillospiraceae bacterium]